MGVAPLLISVNVLSGCPLSFLSAKSTPAPIPYRVYYKDAVGAFLVFDVSRSDSFRAVEKWKTDLDSKVLLPDGRPIPCVLLGNKSDVDASLHASH